jgi:DNA-binding NarL/FixJ family response regulator
VPYSIRRDAFRGEETVGTVLQLSPVLELEPTEESSGGRYVLTATAKAPLMIAAIQVETTRVDGGSSPRWVLVLRDRAGQKVGQLELRPETGPHRSQAGRATLDALTRRQREILELVAAGCAVKTIATRLDISVKTVEFHKTRLMRRLGMHGTAELTRFAVASGLISI